MLVCVVLREEKVTVNEKECLGDLKREEDEEEEEQWDLVNGKVLRNGNSDSFAVEKAILLWIYI